MGVKIRNLFNDKNINIRRLKLETFNDNVHECIFVMTNQSVNLNVQINFTESRNHF